MENKDKEYLSGEASHALRILAILEMHDLINSVENEDDPKEDS
jgi:hypothetical protein